MATCFGEMASKYLSVIKERIPLQVYRTERYDYETGESVVAMQALACGTRLEFSSETDLKNALCLAAAVAMNSHPKPAQVIETVGERPRRAQMAAALDPNSVVAPDVSRMVGDGEIQPTEEEAAPPEADNVVPITGAAQRIDPVRGSPPLRRNRRVRSADTADAVVPGRSPALSM